MKVSSCKGTRALGDRSRRRFVSRGRELGAKSCHAILEFSEKSAISAQSRGILQFGLDCWAALLLLECSDDGLHECGSGDRILAQARGDNHNSIVPIDRTVGQSVRRDGLGVRVPFDSRKRDSAK